MSFTGLMVKWKNKVPFNRKNSFFTDIIVLDHFIVPLTHGISKISFISPNQITVVSGTLGVIAATCYFNNRIWLGVAIMFVSMILDGVDGHLARKTGKTSPIGAKLDLFADSLKKVTSLFALAYISSWNLYLIIGLIVFHYALLRIYPNKYPPEFKKIKFTDKGLEPFLEPYDLLFFLILIGPMIHFEITLILVILTQIIVSTYSRALK